jgi:hypothetical protein
MSCVDICIVLFIVQFLIDIICLSQIHELSRESLWGTHRPNVYVGVRARAPFSPLLGLMWFDADRLDALNRASLLSFLFFIVLFFHLFIYIFIYIYSFSLSSIVLVCVSNQCRCST